MSLDIFDKAVMIIAVVVLVSFSVYYTERPMLINNQISIDASYNDSKNKYLDGVFNSTTTTRRGFNRTTTTTTIAIMVTSDSGSPVAAVDTISGSVIINCGSTPVFIDKLYLNGFFPVRYAYNTGLNETNIGGCSRGFLMHMPGNVHDSGRYIESDVTNNYRYVIGDKIKNVGIGDGFRLVKVNGSVVDEYNGKLSMYITIGSSSMLYLGGCSNCSALIDQYKPFLLVIDDNIEFSIIGYKPHILVGKFDGNDIDGVDIFDLSPGRDFSAYVDMEGMHF